MSARREANYLIFSDVHLGADLVQHVRPWTFERLRQVARIDRDLVAMLDYYRRHRDPERPWHLVIAGDLVDFIGMSIAPESDAPIEDLSEEERRHGLGSTGAHAAAKMRAVARRHPAVFLQLASFIAEGHSLALVRGNHDVDFHWEAAQVAFVDALLACAPAMTAEERAEFIGRVEFYPWFYYVEGLLYVEHGHQFDSMCRYHHLLHPVSPEDPRRTSWSFSDVLLRQVVRPTRGLGSEGHENTGLWDYVRLAWSMGPIAALGLGRRYVSAIARGMRSAWIHRGRLLAPIRAEHERRMEELARRTRVGLEKLRDLSSLWPRPVTRGVLPVMRSVFFDVVLVASLCAILFVLLSLLLPMPWSAIVCAALMLAGAGFSAWSIRLRGREINHPGAALLRGAERIAELFDARFVVMGHTHVPLTRPLPRGSTYVNLGGWAVDEGGPTLPEAPRTHLVLRFSGDGYRADFARWDPPSGGPIPVTIPPPVGSEPARIPGAVPAPGGAIIS